MKRLRQFGVGLFPPTVVMLMSHPSPQGNIPRRFQNSHSDFLRRAGGRGSANRAPALEWIVS
jgi:hypothetical protein